MYSSIESSGLRWRPELRSIAKDRLAVERHALLCEHLELLPLLFAERLASPLPVEPTNEAVSCDDPMAWDEGCEGLLVERAVDRYRARTLFLSADPTALALLPRPSASRPYVVTRPQGMAAASSNTDHR